MKCFVGGGVQGISCALAVRMHQLVVLQYILGFQVDIDVNNVDPCSA